MNVPRDERELRAEALLRANGLDEVRVTAVGQPPEIAAVQAPVALAARLAELAPAVRALGFRYVALDLTTAGE